MQTTEDENTRLQNDHEGTLEENNIDNDGKSEQKSISRNSPELTNDTHNSEQQQQIEENTRQELTEDEMLSQGIAHFLHSHPLHTGPFL